MKRVLYMEVGVNTGNIKYHLCLERIQSSTKSHVIRCLSHPSRMKLVSLEVIVLFFRCIENTVSVMRK